MPLTHPDWLHWQDYYLHHPEHYPSDGHCSLTPSTAISLSSDCKPLIGLFERRGHQDYTLTLTTPATYATQTVQVVTLKAECDRQLQTYPSGQALQLCCRFYTGGFCAQSDGKTNHESAKPAPATSCICPKNGLNRYPMLTIAQALSIGLMLPGERN